MIKERALELVKKLLSFKFVIFVIATVLKGFGIIGNGEWLTIATVVLCGHEGQKGLGRILDRSRLKNEETELGSD